MATVEEVLAKADAWEKAGKPENAAKLRAYAETLPKSVPKYDPATVEAKAAEWEAAGQPDKAAKLREFATTLPKVDAAPKVDPALEGPVAAAPPAALSPQEERQAQIDDFVMFEMANPDLAGRYTPETMPKPGEMVMGTGGGGKSGGARVAVQPWKNVKKDTFGETAAAMVEGPMAGAKAFAGGLTGGPSPSREYLANDPLTGNLPGPLLTGMGYVGDIGGAGLSLVGAGISGLTGLASEAVPGQNSAQERKLAEDLTGMTMFAVPELAGASSVPARMAATAPKAAPVARVAPKMADDVAAAERIGIPVMRTDVVPPKTGVGKIAQRVGESIPIAGTAGMRAKQFAARGEAVMNFVREYVGDTILPAIDDVTAAMLDKRSADLKRFTGMKTAVVEKLKAKGAVPVTRATAEIDRQIAGLKAQRLGELEPVIAKLNDFKRSLADQPLDVLEKNRKAVGSAFADPGLANIRDAGEKAMSAIYAPLREDIAAFVRGVGGKDDLVKWQRANEQLSDMAGQLKDGALKRALAKGEATPETVRSMLFSQKPSDVRRLAENLPENGKAAARTAIVQEAIAKAGGLENLSVERFKNALEKLNSQVGTFFKGEDLEAAQGLLRALKLTEQAAKSGAAPLTGVQNMPAVITLLLSSFTGGSIVGTSAALGTIGGIARIYEATGVKTALRRLGKMQGPKAERAGIKMLEEALKKAGMPASTQAANMPMAVGQN